MLSKRTKGSPLYLYLDRSHIRTPCRLYLNVISTSLFQSLSLQLTQFMWPLCRVVDLLLKGKFHIYPGTARFNIYWLQLHIMGQLVSTEITDDYKDIPRYLFSSGNNKHIFCCSSGLGPEEAKTSS